MVGSAHVGEDLQGLSPQESEIPAPKRAAVVAAEDGTVAFGSSGAAGCYLSLFGKSGITYAYGYLNNDLTTKNDNRARCRSGTSYAKGLKNGQRVKAGEPIGLVGDSGEADGGPARLAFEALAADGAALDPNTLLPNAVRLLFAAPRKTAFALALTGTVVAQSRQRVRLKVLRLRFFPSGDQVSSVGRTIELTVAKGALFEQRTNGALRVVDAGLLRSTTRRLEIWTAPALSSLAAQRGAQGALRASRVLAPPTGAAPQPALASGSLGERAVSLAERFLGVPYVWAGADPLSGFDCSGLVMYVYGHLGISLPHASSLQWRRGKRIARRDLRPGDLVLFEPTRQGPGHVGLYVGKDRLVEAPHTGEVVKVSSLKKRAQSLGYVGSVRPY